MKWYDLMKSRFIFALAIAGLVLSLSGCGITCRSFVSETAGKKIFVDEVANLMAEVTIGSKDRIENKSYPLGIERMLRSELISRFQMEGYLKIVNSPEASDIILRVSITDYEREAVTIQDNNQIDDYRLKINVGAIFIDTKTKTEITKANIYTDSSYELASDRVRDGSSALNLLLSKTARKIAGTLLDQW